MLTSTSTYCYRDETGALLFEVLRCPGKKFFQRDAAGKWGLRETRRVLYGLPELLAAAPGRIIFVVEGEKDVNTARANGLIATTNPGGAGKWRDEYSAFLKGRDVAIFADNDAIGLEHAESVARSVYPFAESVRVLWPYGLPPKGDLTDWFEQGHKRDELIELAVRWPEWKPL